MSIISWFRRGNEEKEQNSHLFNDDERQLSLEVRRQRADLKQMQIELQRQTIEMQRLRNQEQIEEMRERLGYYDDDKEEEGENSIEKMLMMAVLSKMQGTAQPLTNPSPATTVQPKTSLSDDEIEKIVSSIPKIQKKMLLVMSDDKIAEIIKQRIPNIDDDSIHRGIHTLRMGN